MSDDLYQLITSVVEDHWPLDGGNHCDCGWSLSEASGGHAKHVGQKIGDLLIDLAGTGQLLAAIDRIARTGSSNVG